MQSLMCINQAALPDLELRADALKKEKEEAEAAWKLDLAAAPPSLTSTKSGDAAEAAPVDDTSESLQGSSAETGVTVDHSSDPSSPSDAVILEPSKPQQLLDLEEACKDADDAKRSHQR